MRCISINGSIPGPKAIVANLPYNVATPLLLHWLHHAEQFTSLTLMFQREVAERLFAPVGDKGYGRLSIITQLLCTGHILFDLPPEAFTPAPKVTSSVVRLIPRPAAQFAGQDKTKLIHDIETITQMAFGQRRKMLRQSLKPLNLDWAALGIAETKTRTRFDNQRLYQDCRYYLSNCRVSFCMVWTKLCRPLKR